MYSSDQKHIRERISEPENRRGTWSNSVRLNAKSKPLTVNTKCI